MRRMLIIFGAAAICAAGWAGGARAQSHRYTALARQKIAPGTEVVDRVAVRVEDDVITESEIRELGAFQQLAEGKSKPRSELIQELLDQWIVRGEAATAKFPPPTAADVDRSFAAFLKQFPSQEDFEKHCAEAGLSDAAVRRILEQQLYLSRFIDYRFRAAAQVDAAQIEAYYRDEFSPQMKARGDPVPALDDVADTIREVLVQRAISARAAQWLDDTRSHLRIDVVPPGNGP
jgi:hypothetical protein